LGVCKDNGRWLICSPDKHRQHASREQLLFYRPSQSCLLHAHTKCCLRHRWVVGGCHGDAQLHTLPPDIKLSA
jgi:hypothetical protein